MQEASTHDAVRGLHSTPATTATHPTPCSVTPAQCTDALLGHTTSPGCQPIPGRHLSLTPTLQPSLSGAWLCGRVSSVSETGTQSPLLWSFQRVCVWCRWRPCLIMSSSCEQKGFPYLTFTCRPGGCSCGLEFLPHEDCCWEAVTETCDTRKLHSPRCGDRGVANCLGFRCA